ncbi:MAG: hypothetical protein Q4A18_02790 [Rikenellaceae bacterium]|nr:hypothetical protein [Rikenellaceae bacterium]
MSIRLTGGHSFSWTAIEAKAEEVELLTHRTLLVPELMYTTEGTASSFAAAGMPLTGDDQVLAIHTNRGIMALIALERDEMKRLTEHFGEKMRYTTPLLRAVGNIEPTIWIFDAEDLIYIKVYDPKLQMAEVIRVADEADRELLMERLVDACDPKRYTLRLELEKSDKRRTKFYKSYFKKTVCE